MSKSPAITEALNVLSDKLFGRTRSDSLMLGVCVTCGQEVTGFRNPASQREYGISGMCQQCQDSVFGKD